MTGLSTTRQNALLLVVLLFAQLLLMSGSARSAGGESVLRSWVMRLSAPVIGGAGSLSRTLRDTVRGGREMLRAHARNRELEAELNKLRAELRRAREAELENDRLRRLLEMRENLAPRSIGASVVTSNLSGQAKLIAVDRGTRDGVVPDLPVVTWGGAVGRVIEADAGHAVVRVLTDPSSGVAGVVQRSRAQGIVEGRGTDVLEMLYVPRFSDVAHGDRVVTSGLDGIFPRGFGIGRVSTVREVPDGSQSIQLLPEVDFRSIEEVLILLEPVGGGLLGPGDAEGGR